MAFVQGYKHDIFVTYAHVDDMPLPGEDRGWVTALVRNLEHLLSQSLGRADAYSLWMDTELVGNEPFTPTIQSNVRQSATLIAIVSPGFLLSEWCRKEGNAFMEELEKRKRDGQSIFVLEMSPVNPDDLPLSFKDLPRYPFWIKDDSSGACFPLRFPEADSNVTQYFKILHELAQNIVRTLKDLAESTGPQETNATPEPEIVPTEIVDVPAEVQERLNEKLKQGVYDVFLCHNSEDKEEVKRVGRMLMKQGYLTWLDDWDIRPGLPWQEALEEQISNIPAAAVFVGESGFGPWQNMELSAFIRQFVRRRCPVIPVLLNNCGKSPELPVFLSGLHYVDFRSNSEAAMAQLIWGITGRPTPLARRF